MTDGARSFPERTDRLSSMVAAITLGVTLDEAERRGLVVGADERATWRKLAEQIAEIQASGKIVAVQVDAIG